MPLLILLQFRKVIASHRLRTLFIGFDHCPVFHFISFPLFMPLPTLLFSSLPFLQLPLFYSPLPCLCLSSVCLPVCFTREPFSCLSLPAGKIKGCVLTQSFLSRFMRCSCRVTQLSLDLQGRPKLASKLKSSYFGLQVPRSQLCAIIPGETRMLK